MLVDLVVAGRRRGGRYVGSAISEKFSSPSIYISYLFYHSFQIYWSIPSKTLPETKRDYYLNIFILVTSNVSLFLFLFIPISMIIITIII